MTVEHAFLDILDTPPDPVIISSQGTTHCNYSKSKEHPSTIYTEKTFLYGSQCPVHVLRIIYVNPAAFFKASIET